MWGLFHNDDKKELGQMANDLLQAAKEGDLEKIQDIKDDASRVGYQMTQVGEEVQIRHKWWK